MPSRCPAGARPHTEPEPQPPSPSSGGRRQLRLGRVEGHAQLDSAHLCVRACGRLDQARAAPRKREGPIAPPLPTTTPDHPGLPTLPYPGTLLSSSSTTSRPPSTRASPPPCATRCPPSCSSTRSSRLEVVPWWCHSWWCPQLVVPQLVVPQLVVPQLMVLELTVLGPPVADSPGSWWRDARGRSS